MGSSHTTVPAPPGPTAAETELMTEQTNQLKQISGILTQQQSQQTETQNLYKQLSGLYDTGSDGSLTLNQDKVKSLQEQQEKYGALTDEISNLQSERYLKALKGELPVSEATTQQKADEYKLLQENLARRGAGALTGDAPESAAGTSSAAIQSLGQFNRTYKLLEDQERRGELASGGVGSSPGTTSLNSLTQSYSYSPTSLLSGYGTLASGYAQAAQPYAQQRELTYNSQVQNAALQSQQRSAMYGAVGSLAGSGLTALALSSSRTFKKDIEPFGDRTDDHSLKSVRKMPLYTWKYKGEGIESRPHLGPLTEESPEEIVTSDGKHLDVASYFGLLSSAVKALDRKVEAMA